jgi:hypothetical protein
MTNGVIKTMLLATLLAGCGGVVAASDPVSVVEPDAGTPAAGGAGGGAAGQGGMAAPAGQGGAVAGAGGGDAGQGVAGAAGQGGSPAECSTPPTVTLTWTIVDASTLVPLDCTQAGMADGDVRLVATDLGFNNQSFNQPFACSAGTGTWALPDVGMYYSFAATAESPAFTDQRAAWVLDADTTKTHDACGNYAVSVKIAVGPPPSCDPCVQAVKCYAALNFPPLPGACEGLYGDARVTAIQGCQSAVTEAWQDGNRSAECPTPN